MRIINAHNKGVKRAKGGLEKIYLLKTSMLQTIDYDSLTKSYYSVEIDENAAFVGCSFSEGEAVFEESSSRKNGRITIEQKIEFSLNTQPQEAIEFIEDLCQVDCGLVAIIVDANGISRIVGYSEAMGIEQPLRMSSVDGSSQSQIESQPMQKIVLKALSPVKAGVLLDDMSLVTR